MEVFLETLDADLDALFDFLADERPSSSVKDHMKLQIVKKHFNFTTTLNCSMPTQEYQQRRGEVDVIPACAAICGL